jgi:hypothetical protein
MLNALPRHLLSSLVTLAVLALPTLVVILSAAPGCPGGCLP